MYSENLEKKEQFQKNGLERRTPRLLEDTDFDPSTKALEKEMAELLGLLDSLLKIDQILRTSVESKMVRGRLKKSRMLGFSLSSACSTTSSRPARRIW